MAMLLLHVSTNSNNNRNNYCSSSNKNNKSTATTVSLIRESKLWRQRFRWDQFETRSFFSFVASHAFFGDKSLQVKGINFLSENKLVLEPLTKTLYLMYLQILILSRYLQKKWFFYLAVRVVMQIPMRVRWKIRTCEKISRTWKASMLETGLNN